MRPLLPAAAALVVAACSHGAARPAPDRFEYEGYLATYPSGLRAVAYRIAGARRHTLVASFRAGDIDDPPGKEGLARLVARLTRRARPASGGFELLERQFAAGAISAGGAGPDELKFVAVGKPPMLDEMLSVEADRLRQPLAGVDARTFEIERELLANELAREEAPASAALQAHWFVAAAAPGSDYARPPPSAASVRELSLDDARAWARAFLVPRRAIVVVMGPEAPREVTRRVSVAFAAVAGGSAAPAASPVDVATLEPSSPPRSGAVERRRVAVAQPWLWVGWTIPGANELDAVFAAADVVGRLSLASLWGKRRSVAEIEPVVEVRDGLSVVGVRARLASAGDADAVAKALAAELEGAMPAPRLWAGGAFVPSWLPSHAMRVAAADIAWRGVGAGDAGQIARWLRAHGNPNYFAALQRRASEDGGSHERELYSRWIRADRRVAVMFEPDGTLGADAQAPARDESAGWMLTGSDLGASAPGPERVLALADPPVLTAAERWRLPNGLEVAIIPEGDFPVVRGELVVRFDPSRAKGASAVLAASRKPWSFLGSENCPATGWRIEDDHVAFEIEATASHLPDVIGRLGCWTERRAVDGRSLARLKDASARDARDGPGARAGEAAYAAAYPGPYGRYAERSYDAPDDDARAADFLATLRPDRAILVLSGRVAATLELRERVERAFAAWSAPASPAADAEPPPFPAARRVLLADAPAASRAALAVFVRLPPRARWDGAAQLAAAFHVASRVGLHSTSGADEHPSVDLGGPAAYPVLGVSLRTGTAGAADALRGVLDELARTADAPLSDVATNYARWLVARDFAYRFDTPAGIAHGLDDLFAAGLPPDAWEGFPASLAALDPARLRAAARAMAIGREIVAVVGDAKVLEPALRAAGFAPEIVPPRAKRP